MITGELIKTGKTLDNKIKAISKLDGEHVDIGWFQSQGKHPTADLTFPQLAKYHATGGGGRVTPRDVLALSSAVYPPNKDREVIQALTKWLSGGRTGGTEALLAVLGDVQVKRIQSLFGSSLLSPTSGNPDPLVETGALRNKTAYKTSINNIIKE